MILGYTGGPSLSARVFKSGRGSEKSESERMMEGKRGDVKAGKGLNWVLLGLIMKKGHESENAGDF